LSEARVDQWLYLPTNELLQRAIALEIAGASYG
jgi:hypothetical protein